MDEIKQVIEGRAAALSAGNITAMMAYYAPEVTEFSLAPPLRVLADGTDPAPAERWIATFEAPPQRSVTRLAIDADGDIAFATSIDSMTATPQRQTSPFTMWFRVTVGLRRIHGTWLITHEHESVPFAMDGTLRACVDLEP